MTDLQTVLFESSRGAIVALDSAADVLPRNRGRDVLVTASYIGVLPARLVHEHLPRAVIGFDGGVGPRGANIAGLWYYEALNIPAAAVDVMTIVLGDGVDVYDNGRVSFVNRPAADCGVVPGMPAREAAHRMLEHEPGQPTAYQVTNRRVLYQNPEGRQVVVSNPHPILFPVVLAKLAGRGQRGRNGARRRRDRGDHRHYGGHWGVNDSDQRPSRGPLYRIGKWLGHDIGPLLGSLHVS